MPLASRSLKCIRTVSPSGAFKAVMSSSNFSARGRRHWSRGYCDRGLGGYGGLTEINAFVSNDSRVSDVRGGNYEFRQVYNGAYCQAWGAQQQQFWHWRPPQPALPSNSSDYRNWIGASSQPPWECERFKVLSYNILADYLALDHHSTLYFHLPKYMLDWEWRKRRLLIEFGLWSPDIMCLQEVDRFYDLEGELAIRGYSGIWKMRTGSAIDGCAIFWRRNRFQLLYEEHIEFNKLGLRDNVAQICVLESIMQIESQAENSSAAFPSSYCQWSGGNHVIVCNIHVLYNPKRGEVKLGQVRVLIDRAYAVSKDWNNAPVIICGDFNSTPKSPLYNFIATQKLNLSGLARDQISGQYSAILGPNYGFSSYSRDESKRGFCTQQDYHRGRPEYQHNMGDSSPFEYSTVLMHPDVQSRADRPLPFNATTIKLGQAEIYGGGEAQSVSLSFEVQKGHRASEALISVADSSHRGRSYFANGNLSSTSCIDNSTASSLPQKTNFHGFQNGSHYISNAPPFHGNIDDFSTMSLSSDAIAAGKILHVDVADETSLKERPSTPCANIEIPCEESAIHASDRMIALSSSIEDKELMKNMNSGGGNKVVALDKILLEGPTHCGNSISDEEQQPLELSGLEENADPNFFKELLGMEDELQTNMELLEDSSFPQSSAASNKERYLYNPYSWNSMEMEIASGKANCTLVEHPLKLRSVYRDVEDCTGTKDSSREPQVTSYNLQFMGTVDYIWCSEDLLTAAVLDTIPKQVLQRTRGFPTKKWGSDHIALVCELAFSRDSRKI